MTNSLPSLRLAHTDDDLAAVFRLRYEVYIEGMGLQIEHADHQRRWIKEEHDDHSWIVLAEDAGRCVGTSRMSFAADVDFDEAKRRYFGFDHFAGLVPDRQLSTINRLVVAPEYRGSGLALQLFAASYATAARRGVELILGACELPLINYYRKLGFRPFGALANLPGNGIRARIAVVAGLIDETLDPLIAAALNQRKQPSEMVSALLERLDEEPALVSERRVGVDSLLNKIRRQLDGKALDGKALDGKVLDVEAPQIFAGLDAEQIRRLLRGSHLVTARPGNQLYARGHLSRALYMLIAGDIEIHRHGEDQRRNSWTIRRQGALIGEASKGHCSRRRNDAVVGPRGATLLALDNRVVDQLLAGNDALAKIFQGYFASELGDPQRETKRSVARRRNVPGAALVRQSRRARQAAILSR